jgi:site-specific DNA-methyltransferase (adenine-specific)
MQLMENRKNKRPVFQVAERAIEWVSLPVPRLTTTHGMLFQTDCLTFLSQIQSESIHCLFADPPFNLGKEYKNGFKDRWVEKEYFRWCESWLDESMRVLAPGGALFVYALPRLAYRFAAYLDEALEFRHWIALTMKGTFPRGRKLYPAHYALLYFTKGDPRVFNKVRLPIPACRHCGKDLKDYGGHRKYLNPEGLNLTDFWEDTSPNRHKHSKARPGVNELKPLIPSRAIQIATNPRDIVLDPFGGGGSTFQEAQRLGRYWLGCEIGDCSSIEARFEEFAPLTLRRRPPTAVYSVLKGHNLDAENNATNILQRY